MEILKMFAKIITLTWKKLPKYFLQMANVQTAITNKLIVGLIFQIYLYLGGYVYLNDGFL